MTFDHGEIWLLLDSRGVGGIETHVRHLGSDLRRRGLAVRVVMMADYGPHPFDATLEADGIACSKLRGGMGSLVRALRSARPALVHTHGYKAGIVGRIAAKITSTPVVSTFHSGDAGTGYVRLYTWLDLLTAGLSENIAVSAPIADGLSARRTVIPNFIPLGNRPKICGGQSIAFVGRLSAEKGPDQFLEIAKRIPNQAFEVFGDGPLSDELRAAAPPNVHFHGMVDGMDSHWSNIGLLCITSRKEGLPLVALEAMNAGVPVAAFDLGGLASLIETKWDGWLAPADDLETLTHHVVRWSALPASERMTIADRAREKIRTHYTDDAVVPQILKVYARALGRDPVSLTRQRCAA
jgi:glycosyltransferase involved in cell wall biosynthesis